jgi:hypothetical protein
MGFDPCNCSLKIWESIGTPTPKVGAHLGVWGFILSHSPTLFHTPGSMKCDSWASLLAHTFASPCFGREPKVRIATFLVTTSRNLMVCVLAQLMVFIFSLVYITQEFRKCSKLIGNIVNICSNNVII